MDHRIFSNRGGQFKRNSSNLRQVKLPDLTMGTICVIALSVTLCLKLTFSVGLILEKSWQIWEKSWESHVIHEQNPCMKPVCVCDHIYTL